MTPIMCLLKLSGTDPTALHPFDHYCFFKVGSYSEKAELQLPMLGVPSFMNMGYNFYLGKKGTDEGNFAFPNGPILSKCTCPQKKFYTYDFLDQETEELQDFECNDISYFSSAAFFPENNYDEGDPIGTYISNLPSIYCAAVGTSLPEIICNLYSNIPNCPDYGVTPETTGILNIIINIIIEQPHI